MNTNEVAKIVVDICYKIHTKLGPGLFEAVYEEILTHELQKSGLKVERQRPIPVVWDDIKLNKGYRADIIAQGLVLIEIKSIEAIAPVHLKQVLTYLKLTGLKLGLIVNFNEELIKHGIKRVITY